MGKVHARTSAMFLVLAACGGSPPGDEADAAGPPPPNPGLLCTDDADCPGSATCIDGACLGAASVSGLAARNGARLRALRYRSGDGADLVEGWFDSGLGERCQFVNVAPGVAYCLPFFGNAVFADAACTEPAIMLGGRRARYAVSVHSSCGAVAPVVWESTGEAVSAVYISNGERCWPTEDDGMRAHALRPDEIEARFVRADRRLGPPSAGLASLVLEAADGAVAPLLYPAAIELARSCEPMDFRDPVRRTLCVPRPVAMLYGFQDDACRVPAAIPSGHDSCWDTPVAVNRHFCDLVGVDSEPLTSHYGLDTGTCGMSTNLTAYRPAGSADPRIPELQNVVAAGSGRLRPYLIAAAGGAAVAPAEGWRHGFYDTSLDTPCGPYPVSGGWRCLPPTAELPGVFDYYADAGCTEPLLVEPIHDCRAQPEYGYAWGDDQRPPSMHRRVQAHTGDVFFLQTRDECVRQPAPDDRRFYTTRPVPIGDFMELTFDGDEGR